MIKDTVVEHLLMNIAVHNPGNNKHLFLKSSSLTDHVLFYSSSGGSNAGIIIGIMAAIVCGLCIISTIIVVCKRKAAQPGAIILKPSKYIEALLKLTYFFSIIN